MFWIRIPFRSKFAMANNRKSSKNYDFSTNLCCESRSFICRFDELPDDFDRKVRRGRIERLSTTRNYLSDDFRVGGGSFGGGLLLLKKKFGQNTLKSFVIARPNETKTTIREKTKTLWLTKPLVSVVDKIIISILRVSRRFVKSARSKTLSDGVTFPPPGS